MREANEFITIQDILKIKSDLEINTTKLIKHATNDCDLYNAYRTKRDVFLKYQCHQGRHVFKGTEHIVSFIGEDSNRARFIGVYEVCGVTILDEPRIDALSNKPYSYLYDLKEDMKYAALKDRIIINWGNARNWCQSYSTSKEVIEIHQGLHYRQFVDYLSFTLTFNELEEIIRNEYQDWKRALQNVNGIYMIVNSQNHKQYIGSTYGAGGIWGRWLEYVKTQGTGSNKLLMGCKANDPEYTDHIIFTILDILPRTISPNQAVKREILYKEKLGTRAMGLNLN